MFGTIITRIKWLGVILLGAAILLYVGGGSLSAFGTSIGHFFGAIIGFFINIFTGAAHGAHIHAPKVKI